MLLCMSSFYVLIIGPPGLSTIVLCCYDLCSSYLLNVVIIVPIIGLSTVVKIALYCYPQQSVLLLLYIVKF